MTAFTSVLLRGRRKLPDGGRGGEVAHSPASFHISTALRCGDIQSSRLLGENCRRETGALGHEISEKEIEDPCTISVIVFLEKQTNELLEPLKPAGAQPGEWKWEFGGVGPLFIRPRGGCGSTEQAISRCAGSLLTVTADLAAIVAPRMRQCGLASGAALRLRGQAWVVSTSGWNPGYAHSFLSMLTAQPGWGPLSGSSQLLLQLTRSKRVGKAEGSQFIIYLAWGDLA